MSGFLSAAPTRSSKASPGQQQTQRETLKFLPWGALFPDLPRRFTHATYMYMHVHGLTSRWGSAVPMAWQQQQQQWCRLEWWEWVLIKAAAVCILVLWNECTGRKWLHVASNSSGFPRPWPGLAWPALWDSTFHAIHDTCMRTTCFVPPPPHLALNSYPCVVRTS